jgi:hypothetical protein
MKLEFVTAIKDYDLTEAQKVFAYILKYKYKRDLFCESLNVNPKRLMKPRAIDSLAMWRLTTLSMQPQDIL